MTEDDRSSAGQLPGMHTVTAPGMVGNLDALLSPTTIALRLSWVDKTGSLAP